MSALCVCLRYRFIRYRFSLKMPWRPPFIQSIPDQQGEIYTDPFTNVQPTVASAFSATSFLYPAGKFRFAALVGSMVSYHRKRHNNSRCGAGCRGGWLFHTRRPILRQKALRPQVEACSLHPPPHRTRQGLMMSAGFVPGGGEAHRQRIPAAPSPGGVSSIHKILWWVAQTRPVRYDEKNTAVMPPKAFCKSRRND